MTIRLRYMGHNLEVPEGNFIIGRSSSCQLSIDDALVSRRHAMLTASREGARIEDLRSRNGVLVNGARIVGSQALRDGDTITIGNQNLIIHTAQDVRHAVTRAAETRRDIFETASSSDDAFSGSSSITSTTQRGEVINPDKRVHELSLIGAVADKAFSMGHNEDALRLLERPLRDIVDRAKRSSEVLARDSVPPVEPLAAKRAIQLSLKLAQATLDGAWIGCVFEICAARKEVLPQTSIDELYALLRKVRIDVETLRRYNEVLRQIAPHLSPNERFLASRIEGLEPVAALK